MTEEGEPKHPDVFDRWAEDFRQLERELEHEAAELDRLLALLAWTYRQAKAPRSLSDPRNWPGVWPMDWTETGRLALSDPLLFDLVREQAAADLLCEPDLDLNIFQEMRILDCAALLLRSDRPTPGQGMTPGRAAIGSLISMIREAIREWNHWGVKEKRVEPGDPFSAWPTDNAFAEVLADRLNAHPLLENDPDAVPTAEDIRNAIRLLGKRR